MAAIRRFQDFEAWKKARELTRRVYRLSGQGEFGKDFGLRDQVRRAVVSVMSNVAEGFGRGGDREFRQFLCHANGSLSEARSVLTVALDAGYLPEGTFAELDTQAQEISRIMTGLIRYLSRADSPGVKQKRSPTRTPGRAQDASEKLEFVSLGQEEGEDPTIEFEA